MTEPRNRPSPLSALALGADLLARTDDPDALLASLLSLAAEATAASHGAVFVQDPDRPDLEIAATVGLDEADVAPYVAAVTSDDHPVALAAARRQGGYDRAITEAEAAGTGVAADLPLRVGRDGIELGLGVVSLGWAGGEETTADDRALVQALVDLMAVAIDRAQLGSMSTERAEWFERMAHTDALTGLANARLVNRVLELELARAARQGTEVSVAIFDVDGFAETNESAGREVGDDVLRRVAAVLAESVRLVDTVARYGGDEFIVVAPGPAGVTVARRVLDGVAALAPAGGRAITVSAGVARFPVDGAATDELVEAAVRALAEASAAGGNTIAEAAGLGAGTEGAAG